MKNLNASQVRLVLRLLAQLVAAVTAFAVSQPAWAGAVGALTAIEGFLQFVVREVSDDDTMSAEQEAGS